MCMCVYVCACVCVCALCRESGRLIISIVGYRILLSLQMHVGEFTMIFQFTSMLSAHLAMWVCVHACVLYIDMRDGLWKNENVVISTTLEGHSSQ